MSGNVHPLWGGITTTARRRNSGPKAAGAILIALAAFFCLAASAAAAPAWQAADEMRSKLFAAQTELLFDEGGGGEVDAAAAQLRGPLRAGLAADAPAELKEIEVALATARRTTAERDEVALAAARGRIIAALRRGAMAVAIAAAEAGNAARAREWLQIREFRKTTRFTRPGVDGTIAIQELAEREIPPHEAALKIEKDLLDTFQARLLTNLDEAAQAAERDFDGRFAETTAMVRGY